MAGTWYGVRKAPYKIFAIKAGTTARTPARTSHAEHVAAEPSESNFKRSPLSTRRPMIWVVAIETAVPNDTIKPSDEYEIARINRNNGHTRLLDSSSEPFAANASPAFHPCGRNRRPKMLP